MKNIIIVLVVMVVSSGCAAFKPPARWVDKNTFFSDKLPGIEVKVNNNLLYKQSNSEGYIGENIDGNRRTGIDSEWFYFVDQDKKINLRINIETVDTQSKIYIIPLDYSKEPAALIHSRQTVGGILLSTGIIKKEVAGFSCLIKAYSATVNETTRYKILYLEKVDRG